MSEFARVVRCTRGGAAPARRQVPSRSSDTGNFGHFDYFRLSREQLAGRGARYAPVPQLLAVWPTAGCTPRVVLGGHGSAFGFSGVIAAPSPKLRVLLRRGTTRGEEERDKRGKKGTERDSDGK